MKQVHKLGSAQGKMIEKGDGTVSYRPFGKAYPSMFNIRIADVDRVVWKSAGISSCEISVVGVNGQVLESCLATGLAAQRIDEWFRAHPDFRGTGTSGLIG